MEWTAESIASLRKALGLSCEKFRQRLGVSLPTVYRWESGTSVPIPAHQEKLDKLAKKADALAKHNEV